MNIVSLDGFANARELRSSPLVGMAYAVHPDAVELLTADDKCRFYEPRELREMAPHLPREIAEELLELAEDAEALIER